MRNSNTFFMGSFLLMVVIAVFVILLFSFTRITDADVGIRQTFSGEIEDVILGQGLHQTLIGDVIKVSKRNLVLNVDSQPIVIEKIPMQDFQLKVNYGIVPENAAIAYKTEKSQHIITDDGDVYLLGQYVQYVANSAINDVVSKYRALEVNDNRAKIETEIKNSINSKLKSQNKDRFVKVNEINILKVSPPQSILNSSLAIVNSQNALKTKQNELETARVETEIKKVLAENASDKYVDLLRAEAEKTKAEALLKAAEKGTLNTMVIVPDKFTSLGQNK
ncbi:SPFH domain-containing protein [Acinetobacter shaoyimingii]|uniref:Band 7 domain-containing protein n=1 Tax=Acinetobacter shaoyimingii TaxID=2715164 RepID=A0A6G8RWL2_9GAMM|nr:SPFH domain-containing protein [Acinetobacter shaoyimingii]QIO06336.1 hypothetical protein G8E00_10420 [Acinetobacter shaoyimingii]